MQMYDTLVDPALAAEMLEKNRSNRRLNRGLVEAYARDMRADNWHLTGEAIKFDTADCLIDGQHRLSAVITSGRAVRMTIVEGLDPEAQRVMDTGRKRTVADALAIGGHSYSNVKSAAARLAMREPAVGYVQQALPAPTASEVLEFIQAFDAEMEEAAPHGTEMGKMLHVAPSTICVAWMRLAQVDRNATSEFFYSLYEQRTNGQGDPRLALVRALNNLSGQKIKQREHLSLIFRAWNAWRQGRSMATLRLRSNGTDIPLPTTLV